MGIYEKIKMLAAEKGIKISALERELGFAKGSLCKIDRHKPSDDKVNKLAHRLGVNADWLMGREIEDSSYSDKFRNSISVIMSEGNNEDIMASIDTAMVNKVIDSNGPILLDVACGIADQLGETMSYLLDEDTGLTIKSVLENEDGPLKEVFQLMLSLPTDKQRQAAEILRVFASPSKPQ